ncbi:MAG TPA: AAA family ATPase [Streptosporangiaceae bacterium]|nr:AAA family ATPase [Streptosporangiaceae bacterium]
MLYGRDAEVARIDELLAQARTGHSGALSVCGDAGVGKTALLEYAVDKAGGMRLLRVTCVESEAELPFAGLHLLLRPALTRLGALPAPQAAALRGAFGLAGAPDAPAIDRFLTGLATLTLLSELADGEPTLCVVDDAHWLDQASATAMLFAARRLDAEGVALVFGSRGGQVCGASGLPAMRLAPLDRESAARLLADQATDLAPAVLERVIEQSEGYPLALIELPAALTPEQRAGQLHPQAFHVGTMAASGRVQDAFGAQIAGLPEPTRVLLLVAAADDSEDLSVVLRAGELLGAALTDLAPAEETRLIRLADGGLRFRHPLIRAAAYQSASSAQRMAVHRALAQCLTTAGQRDRRAWHLAAGAAGPDDEIAAELERAARDARRRGGYAAEAAAYERAAQLSQERAARGQRLALAAAATAAAGDLRHAGAMAERAALLVHDPVNRAGLAQTRAGVEFETGSSARSAGLLLDGAAGLAGPAPGPVGPAPGLAGLAGQAPAPPGQAPSQAQAREQAARMLTEAAHQAMYSSSADVARRAAEELAKLDPPAPYAAFVPAVTGLALIMADELTTGVRAIRETLRAVDAYRPATRPTAGQPDPLPAALRRLAGVCALTAGDDQAAHEHAATLAATCREQGMISLLPHALQLLAAAQQFAGRHADARASGLEGLRIAQETAQHHRVAHLSGVLGRLAAVEGDEQACLTLSGQAATWDSAPAVASAGDARGLLDLGLGRAEAALAQLAGLVTGPVRHTLIAIFGLPDLVEAAADAGRPELGAPALARFEAYAEGAAQPWAAAVALRCRALLGDDPAGNFDRAVRLHAGRPFERARTELRYGAWLRRERRRADARDLLESALVRFTRLNAAPWAERARAELRAAGVAVPATSAGDRPAGDLASRLTPQELQVVRHAAAGLSNREIAALLFLSPRTVGYHLYKAYPKLNVTARAQLARIVLPPVN